MIDLRPLRQYLRYGKIKSIAESTGVNKQRAWKLLQGVYYPNESDMMFVEEVIKTATIMKQMQQRVNQITL